MNKKKKTILALAGLLVAFSILSGCSKESGNKTQVNEGAISEDTQSKQIELSVAVWDIQTGFEAPNAANDTINNNLESQLNISIKPIQITWNDWMDKIKVWAASNQLPDIFANAIATDNPGLYQTWAKQGVIKALPEDLSAYPNLQKIFSLPSVQPLKIDGKFYMIPRMTYADSSDWALDRSIRYRKDWAAEAGYTNDPSSFEEFVEMTQAVMVKHPEINGLTTNNKSYLMTQFLGSFPELSNTRSWVKEDGKWIPSYTSTKAYTGIEQLRTLYTNGILDKDFAIQKDADGVSKFLAGQSFAVYGLPLLTIDQLSQFEKANPTVSASKAIGYMNIWPAADGKRYTFVETPYWSETYFSNKLDDVKFERALKLMDYLVSDEYLVLPQNGIEGTDYKVEDGKSISLLSDDQNLGDKYPITKNFSFLGQWNNGFIYTGKKVVNSNAEMAKIEQGVIDTFNKFKKEDIPAPINFDVMLLSTPAKNKLGSLNVVDDIVNVVIGKDDPIAQWKKIVEGYNSKGLQAAINEVNEEVTKQGIQ
ncbi:extracellular solute-binding protein [Paenibacillus donghaensis]|nr:extracellular solute-binding protein [Paenibacillus donghaensis]